MVFAFLAADFLDGVVDQADDMEFVEGDLGVGQACNDPLGEGLRHVGADFGDGLGIAAVGLSSTLSRRKWSTKSSGRPVDNPYDCTSRKCRTGRSCSTTREMCSGSNGSNSQTVRPRSGISSCSG